MAQFGSSRDKGCRVARFAIYPWIPLNHKITLYDLRETVELTDNLLCWYKKGATYFALLYMIGMFSSGMVFFMSKSLKMSAICLRNGFLPATSSTALINVQPYVVYMNLEPIMQNQQKYVSDDGNQFWFYGDNQHYMWF